MSDKKMMKKEAKQIKKFGAFYPIPAGRNKLVAFSTPEGDGFEFVRDQIRPSRAKAKYLPRDYMMKSVVRIYGEPINKERVAKISLKKISRKYATKSYVSMDSLKAMKLIPEQTTYLIIKARGKLKKCLMVEAHEMSKKAARMLILTGGRPILLKKELKPATK